MIKELRFVKLANKWHIQLPDFPGDPADLEMVFGADDLCELLDEDKDGTVDIAIWVDEAPDVSNYMILSFIYCEGGGAWYMCPFLGKEIWFCEVLKHVCGKFPTTIYFYAYGHI